MTYDASEASRDAGRPVELYEILRRVAGAAGGFVWAEDFSAYADTPAFLAAWVEGTEGAATAAATWDLDATHVVAGETMSAHLHLVGTATDGDIYKVTLLKTGLVPGASYSFVRRAWATEVVSGLPPNVFNLITTTVVADGSGVATLILRLTTPGGGTFDIQIWFGGVQLIRQATAATQVSSRYTSHDAVIVSQGQTYYPSPIGRSPIPHGDGEAEGGDVRLTLPRDHAIALAAGRDGAQALSLILRRAHIDAPDDVRVRFRGLCTEAAPERAECVLTFRPLAGLLDVPLPRFKTGLTCPFVTYDEATCGVIRSSFTLSDVPVTVVSGTEVTVAGLAAFYGADTGYFVLGTLVLPSGLELPIQSVSGDVLTLFEPRTDIAVDDVVSVIAGDDHTAATCRDRFGNISRFGASTKLPARSPYRGAGLAP